MASLHATAADHESTPWSTILSVYDVLVAHHGSPVLLLNRAVALAEVDGPDAALAALAELDGDLDDYQYLHSTRAELLHRLGRCEEACSAMRRAIELAGNDAEIAWMHARIDAWQAAAPR